MPTYLRAHVHAGPRARVLTCPPAGPRVCVLTCPPTRVRAHLVPAREVYRAIALARKLVSGEKTESFQKVAPLLNVSHVLDAGSRLRVLYIFNNYVHDVVFAQAFAEANPGSRCTFQAEENCRFRRAFLMPAASVIAFHEGRKALVVDAAHMRNGYAMRVLNAAGYDARGQMYVVASALVSGE